MSNVIVRDLAGYNRKIKLSNSDVITFVGQFATVSSTDAALLVKSGEYVVTNTVTEAPALATATQAIQTVETAKATAAIATNQVSGASGLSASTKAANNAEIARANAAFAANKEAAGAQP